MVYSFDLNWETVLKSVFKGVTFALSYHNKVVVQLEAVEDPGSWSEQGGYREWEGQALHITTAHYSYLKGERGEEESNNHVINFMISNWLSFFFYINEGYNYYE